MDRLRELPFGAARSAAFEQLVDELERRGPADALALGYAGLVESLVWGQESVRAFAPFTRWLRWADAHPEHLADDDQDLLLWSFKWTVSDLMEQPGVPSEQIGRMLDLMEARFAAAGVGVDAIAHQRFLWAWAWGDARAGAAFDAWVAAPRDALSQCAACEPGDRAGYLFDVGRTAEGIAVLEAALVLDPVCATEPADMLSQLQLAYLEVGRHDDAARTHRRALAALDEAQGAMAAARGRHVEFLARTGHAERALRRLEAESALLDDAPTPFLRLRFLGHAGVALEVLRASAPQTPVRAPGRPGTVAELSAWVHAEADALAARFDARDGNRATSGALARVRARRPVAHVVELSVLPRGLPVGDPAGWPMLVTRAERATDGRDLERAAVLYLAAAHAAEADGKLEDAGFAFACAARCAQEVRDDDGAAWAYDAGIALLRAAGVDALRAGPVVRAWAPVAGEHGEAAAVLELATSLVDELRGAEAGRAARTEAARLADVVARALATLHRPDAARAAGNAGEALASVGLTSEAADAFWLAGRIHAGAGQDEEAVWSLESAVEGFWRSGDDTRRSHAAGDLIALLRRQGHTARADDVARTLAG